MPLSFNDLDTMVKFVVGDPQGDTFSATHYSEAIEFSIRQYAAKTGVTYVEVLSPMDSSGYVALPADYLKINRILVGTKQLIESSISFAADKSETWTADTADAVKRWVLWSGSRAKVLPLMTTYTATTATVGYVQKPVALSGTYTVDARIPQEHNVYLKYAAASYLLHLDGDSQSLPLADKYMTIFNQLIGYEDPVLQFKENLMRKSGKLEV